MTSNDEIVGAAYRTAEGSIQDLEGWRNAFTEDEVFNNIAAGESYAGDRLSDVVTDMGACSRTSTASCSGYTRPATWSWWSC